ncbi:uncharacterized protein LOC144123146 [Amblyomma americanum]
MNGEPQQVVDKTHGASQTLHRCPRRSPHSSTHQSPHCSPQRVPRLAFLGSDGETMGPIRCCARCCMNRIVWIPLLTPGTARTLLFSKACWRPYGRWQMLCRRQMVSKSCSSRM